eukprot:Awhi_evm1s1034
MLKAITKKPMTRRLSTHSITSLSQLASRIFHKDNSGGDVLPTSTISNSNVICDDETFDLTKPSDSLQVHQNPILPKIVSADSVATENKLKTAQRVIDITNNNIIAVRKTCTLNDERVKLEISNLEVK